MLSTAYQRYSWRSLAQIQNVVTISRRTKGVTIFSAQCVGTNSAGSALESTPAIVTATTITGQSVDSVRWSLPRSTSFGESLSSWSWCSRFNSLQTQWLTSYSHLILHFSISMHPHKRCKYFLYLSSSLKQFSACSFLWAGSPTLRQSTQAWITTGDLQRTTHISTFNRSCTTCSRSATSCLGPSLSLSTSLQSLFL